ncbi:ABC transporter permease [Buchananella felis]|uniref:ABC transporter permease n=1 Tax=Buchananella felis TaxID=3231492 RepID=UPI003529C883
MLIGLRRRTPDASPLPRWVNLLALLGLAFMVVPMLLMASRVPWLELPKHLSADSSQDALWLSLRTSALAVAIDLFLGIPLAVWLAKGFKGVRAVRIAVALPLALPPVVAGMALISAFGRKGLIGGFLDSIGLGVTFTTTAVVLAQVFVSLPFLVVTLEAALRARPRGLEETAASLGASPTRVLRKITLPMVLPGLARGTALALARCLGEFGATLTFAGSRQGVTRTMPIEIYLAREGGQDAALALGMLLVLMAIAVVAVTEWPGRRRRPNGAGVPEENDSATEGGVVPGTGQGAPQGKATRGGQAQGAGEPASVYVNGKIEQRGWQIDLRLPAGQVSAIMGHNGAGKSTLAEVLSGHLALDSGEARIAEQMVDGPNEFVPARNRGVAMLSQDPKVFGHMTVLDNVAFPLRCHGYPRARAQAAALEQLRLVGCAGLARSRGDELSGGQAARVALARALALEPRLLILDEPTASLDVEATALVSRIVVQRLARSRTTTLLITHDLAEAMQLASHLVVLDSGRVAEEGQTAKIMARPGSAFGARLAGLNVIQGLARPDQDGLWGIQVGPARLVAAAETGEARAASGDLPGDGAADRGPADGGVPMAMLFAPESVALFPTAAHGSPRTAIPATIEAVEIQAGLATTTLRIPDGQLIRARVTAAAWAELGLATGQRVEAQVKATQVRAIHLPARSAD